MDPFTIIGLATSAIGLGMQIFGGKKQASDASAYSNQENQVSAQEAGVSQDVAKQEQGINDLKQRQMEIEGTRAQMENIRNIQRARALSLNSATQQGAQYGSGLSGGQAGITDAGLFHMQGIDQSLAIGRGINSFNQGITNDKLQMATLQSQMSMLQSKASVASTTDQGLTSLGGAVMKAGPFVGQISSNLFKGTGSGNFSGTPGASNTGGLY